MLCVDCSRIHNCELLHKDDLNCLLSKHSLGPSDHFRPLRIVETYSRAYTCLQVPLVIHFELEIQTRKHQSLCQNSLSGLWERWTPYLFFLMKEKESNSPCPFTHTVFHPLSIGTTNNRPMSTSPGRKLNAPFRLLIRKDCWLLFCVVLHPAVSRTSERKKTIQTRKTPVDRVEESRHAGKVRTFHSEIIRDLFSCIRSHDPC